MLIDSGDRAFSVTNLKQVAAAVVTVLQHPQETANQYLYVDSFAVTQKEILAVLQKEIARKWDVKEMSTVEAVKEGKAMLGRGDAGAMGLLLTASFVGEGFGNDFTSDAELANGMLGLPREELGESVRSLVAGR